MSVDSSLIFLIVIGLWMAYLVPTWLRRREQMSASRADDRFSDAMHVLSPRPEPDRSHVSPAHAYVLTPPPLPVAEPDPAEVQPVPARRGRRTRLPRVGLAVVGLLVVSVLAVPGSVALAVLALAPEWSPVVPCGVLVLLVAALRLRARRRSTGAGASGVSTELFEDSGVTEVERDDDHAAADGGRTASLDVERELLPGEWTPVPVPLPSYLLKDEVPRRRASALEFDEVSRWHADWREQPAATEAASTSIPDVDEDDIPTYAPPVRRALGA